MTSPIPFGAHLSIVISTLFWALLLILFLTGLPVLLYVSPTLAGGLAGAALILAIIITWLLRVASYAQSLRPFLFVLLKPFLLVLFLLVSLTTLPIYYLAYKGEVDPLLLPHAEISNGEKTIVFQGMIHIGNEAFYKSVVYDLETALDNGYKLFYEGVKPSTPENDAWFAKTGAGAELGEKYQDITKVCGVKFQLDYLQLMAHDMEKNPDRHFTADVDTAQLKAEYDRLMRDDSAFAFTMKLTEDAQHQEPGSKYVAKIIEFIKQNSEGQQRIAGVLCRGVFALALDPTKTSDGPLNKLILDFRTHNLANAISADPSSKIYITYSAAHLPGVLTLLRKADPRWEIKSVKWLRGMTHPQDDTDNPTAL